MDSDVDSSTTISREQAGWIACPNCGERSDAEVECCWLCNRNLAMTVAAQQVANQQIARPVKLLTPLMPRQFSLQTLMLLVTLASVLLSRSGCGALVGNFGNVRSNPSDVTNVRL